MIKRFELQNGSLLASESENSLVQVYINPDQTEKNSLLTQYDLDEHTLSSALDPDEISRVEFSPDYLSIIWKRPMNYSAQDNFVFNVTAVGLFLFKERLIIVLNEDTPLFLTGIRQLPKMNSLLDVILNFLYKTIHHYLEHLKVIKMISRDLQKKINTSMENKHLIQMFSLSESLVYYLNAINANNVVLVRLRNHFEKTNFPSETIELIDDIIIENNQCYKQAEIYSTIFSGLMDARGTLVNNNMNVLLKNLTIINVVFLPLNLIASIFGMSEFSMITQKYDWRISYSFFFISMILIGWLTAYFLGKMNFGGRTVQQRIKKIFPRKEKHK